MSKSTKIKTFFFLKNSEMLSFFLKSCRPITVFENEHLEKFANYFNLTE